MAGGTVRWNKGDFVDIVKVTGGGNLAINYRGIETLFANEQSGQDPVSTAVVFGPDEDVRSKLISQLLSFKLSRTSHSSSSSMKHLTSAGEETLTMSDIFFTSKSMESQRIVAWTQPVRGKNLDGTERCYYFLDIWGQFNGGLEDPVYIRLAGIAAVLASTVVYVQRSELISSSLDWIKNVLNIAVKTGKVSNLQSLSFFVLDWAGTDSIKCGQRDGHRYLSQVLEQNACTVAAQTVTKRVLELSCYLYPKPLPSNDLDRQQHASKFQQLVLDESRPKQVSKDVDFCGANVLNLLKDLEVEWSNLMNVRDDGMLQDRLHSLVHKASPDILDDSKLPVDNIIGEGPSQIEIPVVKNSIYFEILASRMAGLKEKSAPLIHLARSRLPIGHHGTNRAPLKKMTLLEFEALSQGELQCGNDVNSSEKEPTENSNSMHQINETLAGTVVEASSEDQQNLKCPPSVDDILKDIFKDLNSPQSKVAEALAIDHFKTFKPSLEVREFFINIQFTAPQVTNNSLFEPQRPNVPSLQQNSVQKNVLGPVHPQTLSDSDLRTLQDILTHEVVESFKKAQLQSEISNEELYEDAYRNAMHRSGNRIPVGTGWQAELRQQLDSAFKCIGHCQTKMDEMFKEKAFFADQENFEVNGAKLFEDIFNQYGDLGALTSPTQDKITQLKTEYGRLNLEIRSTEELCAYELLGKVKEYYLQEIKKTPLGNVEEMKAVHRKLSDKCVNGFITALNCPNPEITQQLVKKLETELSLTFESTKHGLQCNVEMGKDNLDIVRHTILSECKAEVEHFINNPSFNSLEQLQNHQKVHLAASVQKYITELKKNPTKDSSRVPCFKNDLKSIFQCLESRATEKLRSLAAQKNVAACGNSRSSKDSNWRANPYNLRSQETNKKSNLNSTPVAIHFSLKTLTVGIKRDNSFETLYGPESNTVSIGEEILIGKEAEGTGTGVSKFNMKSILLNPSSDGAFSCNKYKKLRIEVIIAFLLSKVHQIAQRKLHTTKIQYVIAIPTCFNSKLQTMMGRACQIAGIEATLVLETCALAVQLITRRLVVPEDKHFFVGIEDEALSCDISLYKITNRILTLTDISCAKTSWTYIWTTSGLSNALSKFSHFTSQQAVEKVGVLSTNPNGNRKDDIVKEVTKEMYENTLVEFAKPLDIIHGTCVLAFYRYNEEYYRFWNENDKYKMNLAELVSNHFPRGNLLSTPTKTLWPALEANAIAGLEQFVAQKLKWQETKLRNKRDALQKKCLQKAQSCSTSAQNEINKVQIQIASEGNSFQDLERLHDQLNKM